MAITDILNRIQTDADSEAAEVTAVARAEAARIVKQAQDAADADRSAACEAAARDAAREAATLLASARLAARDRLLGEKRVRAERVLERARQAIEALPDDEYLAFIAAHVARASAGGETLTIAAADAARLGPLLGRLAEMGTVVTSSAAPAPIEHGVLLTGDRIRIEVSPASLIADARDELLLVAARELFGTQA